MSSHTRSPEVEQRFASELPLVEIVAKQVGRSLGAALALDELMSFGHEGLLDAARRYDPSRGVPFRAYANFRVKGAILDGVRSMARLPRRLHRRLNSLHAALGVSEGVAEDLLGATARPSATEAETALTEHLAAMATAMAMGLVATPVRGEDQEPDALSLDESPEEELQNTELSRVVRAAIDELPKEEAELVRRHYLEGERFDEVAQELGLSKSWASRLHSRAVGRLTKRLRKL